MVDGDAPKPARDAYEDEHMRAPGAVLMREKIVWKHHLRLLLPATRSRTPPPEPRGRPSRTGCVLVGGPLCHRCARSWALRVRHTG